MPDKIKERVVKFKRWQDAHASLLGKHLLLHAMSDLGYDISLNDLQYTQYDRPFIANNADFNISHSGTLVVCVISNDGRIGIDIEEKKPIDITDFNNQFSPEEWSIITQSQPATDSFYDYWSSKEAILKADGIGISVALSALNTANRKEVDFNNQKWYLLRVDDFPDYACHIACNVFSSNYHLHQIDFHTATLHSSL